MELKELAALGIIFILWQIILQVMKSDKPVEDNIKDELMKRINIYDGDFYLHFSDKMKPLKINEIDAGVNLKEFIELAKSLFFYIKNGYYRNNLFEYKDYMSDRIYLSLLSEKSIEDRLKLEYQLEKLKIRDARVADIKKDEEFIVIDVVFDYLLENKTISNMIPELNKFDSGMVSEKWSFIKTIGVDSKDKHYDNCPNCGSKLEISLSDSLACKNCNSIIRSNRYNWIVSEISSVKELSRQLIENRIGLEKEKTKEVENFFNDMINNKFMYTDELLKREKDIFGTEYKYKVDYEKMHYIDEFRIVEFLDNDLLKEISMKDKKFSIQNIEDKANHAIVEIIKGKYENNHDIYQRYLTDEFYSKMVREDLKSYLSNLNINQVVLTNLEKNSEFYKLSVFINYKYKSLELELEESDFYIENNKSFNKMRVTDRKVKNGKLLMELIRSVDVQPNMGNLYTHNCSSCGGNIDEITDIHCNYCGNELNNPDYEWIVNDLKFIGSDFL